MSKSGRYKFVETIGTGAYGIVSKCMDSLTGEEVAVKKIIIESAESGIPSLIIREASILKQLKHPNVIKLLDVERYKRSIDLVFELLDFDLNKFMKRQPNARSPITIKKYLKQILLGVSYCHAHNIVHRDLKPANVLVDVKNDRVKVADFDLARPIDVPSGKYTPEMGTPCYMAPELLLDHSKYSAAVDIWS